MTANKTFVHDAAREARTGLTEAILCEGKSDAQLAGILATLHDHTAPVLFTRLAAERHAALSEQARARLDYDPESRTAILGTPPRPERPARVAVVSAGTSDIAVAREAVRTLACAGEASLEVYDVGVAGLWRLLERSEALAPVPIKIVVAGMDGALPTVVSGLLPGIVIGVPCSTGYGAADGGRTALAAMLASCGPGLTVCNIDNGYGAATAALRALRLLDSSGESS